MRLITIDGRLGGDAEVKTTSGGTQYIKFTVANRTYENKEVRTDWFDVTSFSKLAIDVQSKFLKKGSFVIVSGTLKSDVNANGGKIYLNHYINATQIEVPMLGDKKEDNTDEPVVSTYTDKSRTVQQEESKINVHDSEKPIVVEEEPTDDLPF